jgi:tetratricopeptide (TPR) repeat protein
VLQDFWERLSRVEAASSRGMLVVVVGAMSLVSAIAVLLALLGGGIAPLAIAALGWMSFLLVVLLHGTVLNRAAKLLIPTGSSTPSEAQHSALEALEARGDYAGAAAAYRAAIERDPRDVVACEKLGKLAAGALEDYPLAVFAYHEAARRVAAPRRRLGYRLLAASVCRDQLRDIGRTIVEYRRILEEWPDAPNAAALRTELAQLKAEHFRTA